MSETNPKHKGFRRNLVLLILSGVGFALLVVVATCFLTAGQTFINPKTDTGALTIGGFAVFATLTNICFALSKSYPIESAQFREIKNIGESALLCTILFILASVVKFSDLNTLAIAPGKAIPYLKIGSFEIDGDGGVIVIESFSIMIS